MREIAEAEEPQEYVCVAEETAGGIVGIAMGGPPKDWPFDDANRAIRPTGECYSLYVAKNRQRNGIGRALVTDLAGFLVSRGRGRLAIGVLTVNTPARTFYERIGGTLLGERTFDDSGVLLDEVVYVWDDAACLGRAEPAVAESALTDASVSRGPWDTLVSGVVIWLRRTRCAVTAERHPRGLPCRRLGRLAGHLGGSAVLCGSGVGSTAATTRP